MFKWFWTIFSLGVPARKEETRSPLRQTSFLSNQLDILKLEKGKIGFTSNNSLYFLKLPKQSGANHSLISCIHKSPLAFAARGKVTFLRHNEGNEGERNEGDFCTQAIPKGITTHLTRNNLPEFTNATIHAVSPFLFSRKARQIIFLPQLMSKQKSLTIYPANLLNSMQQMSMPVYRRDQTPTKWTMWRTPPILLEPPTTQWSHSCLLTF